MKNVFSSLFTFDSEFIKESELLKWLDARNRANEFIVKPVPFRELDKWKFNEETGYLQHDSGKFFSIEGLKVHTDFGEVPSWEQVIINQPEVGILGIITKVIKIILTILVLIFNEQKIKIEKTATNNDGKIPIVLLKTKVSQTAVATKKPAIKCFIFIIHFPGFGKKFMSCGEIINII